jgi:molecular chaperone IbpA
MNMTNFDFSPLFRSTVGFDRLARMIDSSLHLGEQTAQSYPPYNILKTGENAYRIVMAVAGFALHEIDITAKDQAIIIHGKKQDQPTPKDVQYLHRGIAERSFERRFQLADHIKVESASLEHGLLSIELVREIPEAMKPRKIEIQQFAAETKPLIEG